MNYTKINDFHVIHHEKPSNIANARIIVHAGKMHEDPDSYGTAHYLEHMMFKGTERRNYKELNKKLSLLGSVNAYTNHGVTVYHLTFLADDFEEAIGILLEMVFESTLPADEFDREKGVILEECKTSQDNPFHIFSDRYLQHLLGDTLGHPILGTNESIAATTVEKLSRFRTANYRPNHIAVSIAGNISPTQVQMVLHRLLPDRNVLERTEPVGTLNLEDFSFTNISQQAILKLTSPGIILSEELKGRQAADVFNEALGGGMHSLLFDRLREELGLCYSVSSNHSSSRNLGTQNITCLLAEENLDLAINECLKIVDSVKKNGFSDDLLNIAKKQVLFSFGRRTETSSGINSLSDGMFELGDYPLEKYLNEAEQRRAVASLTQDDMVKFANHVYGNVKIKITKMTHEKEARSTDANTSEDKK